MSFAAHYSLPFPREAAPVAPLVPAVARALTLLDRLARGREPMTLARLSSELALPKSSVHGLCTTLVSFGYLRRQADGSFLIGPRVMGLAEAFVARGRRGQTDDRSDVKRRVGRSRSPS